MLGQTKPKIIFCETTNIGVIKKALQEIGLDSKLYTSDGKVEGEHFIQELFKDHGDDLSFKGVKSKDPDNFLALIVCSSGTTGKSKGIGITHRAYSHVEIAL